MIPTCRIGILSAGIWIILIDCIDSFIYTTTAIIVIVIFDNILDTNSKANRSFIALDFIYFEYYCSIDWIEWILR
jgi:hypothetical protein